MSANTPKAKTLTYLQQHNLQKILESIVNKVVKEKPRDPFSFLAAEFAALALPPLPEVVLVLGGPASGKSMNCSALAHDLGWIHLSLDSVIREERLRTMDALSHSAGLNITNLESSVDTLAEIDECLRSGRPIPSETLMQLLKNTIDRYMAAGSTQFLVEGIPISLTAYETYKRICQPGVAHDFLFVISLEAPDHLLEDRQTVRADGSVPIWEAKRRVKTWHEESNGLVASFAPNQVRTVDATQSLEQVYSEMRKLIAPVTRVQGFLKQGTPPLARLPAAFGNVPPRSGAGSGAGTPVLHTPNVGLSVTNSPVRKMFSLPSHTPPMSNTPLLQASPMKNASSYHPTHHSDSLLQPPQPLRPQMVPPVTVSMGAAPLSSSSTPPPPHSNTVISPTYAALNPPPPVVPVNITPRNNQFLPPTPSSAGVSQQHSRAMSSPSPSPPPLSQQQQLQQIFQPQLPAQLQTPQSFIQQQQQQQQQQPQPQAQFHHQPPQHHQPQQQLAPIQAPMVQQPQQQQQIQSQQVQQVVLSNANISRFDFTSGGGGAAGGVGGTGNTNNNNNASSSPSVATTAPNSASSSFSMGHGHGGTKSNEVSSPSTPLHTGSSMLPRPRIIFVLGAPGSGKSTICARLASEYGYVHLQVQELLKEERLKGAGSELAQAIESHIAANTPVPIEVTMNVIRNAISTARTTKWKHVFLLDGFPRNQTNLDGWLKLAGTDLPITASLFLDCKESELEKRCLVKRSSEKKATGTASPRTTSPRGGSGGGVKETIESIQKKFLNFVQNALPVLTSLEKMARMHTIDASEDLNNVYPLVVQVLQSYQMQD